MVEEEDDEAQILDMTKALERFGFKDSEELSSIREEDPEGKEDMTGPPDMEEPEEEDHGDTLECHFP